jgi:polyphosphate kinase
LEHVRLLVFGNDGQPEVYISSADWMTRNLDRRVEVSVPIRDGKLQSELFAYLDLQMQDNLKLRVVDGSMKNQFVKAKAGSPRVDAQAQAYSWYQKAAEQS